MSGTNPNAQQGPMSAGKGGMRNPGPGGNAQNNPMGQAGMPPMQNMGRPSFMPDQGQSWGGFGQSQIQPGTPFPSGMAPTGGMPPMTRPAFGGGMPQGTPFPAGMNPTGGLTPMQNLQGMLRPSNLMAQQPMPQQSYGAPRPAMPPMGLLSMFNKRG